MTTIDPLLLRAESTLIRLQSEATDAPSDARQFGLDLYEIGRALNLDPTLEPRVVAFVERTAPLVQRCTALVFWVHRVADAAESRSSETAEYTGALVLRSSLEFFRELYRDTAARDCVAELETDETDESLREWGAEQYLEQVPAGIPASHVWWHQSRSGK